MLYFNGLQLFMKSYSFYFLSVTVDCKILLGRVCLLMAAFTKCFLLGKIKNWQSCVNTLIFGEKFSLSTKI